MKKILSFILIFTSVFMAGSCFLSGEVEKEYTVDDFHIVLTQKFKEESVEGFDLVLTNTKYLVSISKTTAFSSIDALISQITLTIPQARMEKYEGEEVSFHYAVYNNKGNDDVVYSYTSAIYEYNGCFYILDMATTEKNSTDKTKETMLNWAKSVTLGEKVVEEESSSAIA